MKCLSLFSCFFFLFSPLAFSGKSDLRILAGINLSDTSIIVTQSCTALNSIPAIPPTSGKVDTLTGPIIDVYYSINGSVIYSSYDSTGNGTFTSIPLTDTFWTNTTGSNGPLNRCGVWARTLKDIQSVGFSVCIDIDTSKDYYVGFGADNYATLKIDSKVILQQPYTTGQENLNVWKIFKITLAKGKHFVEVLGNNAGLVATIGFEIYDNTASQIMNATSYSNLNLVFSSKDQIGKPVQDGDSTLTYSCPAGYSLDYCSSNIPVCSQVINQNINLGISSPWAACYGRSVDITSPSLITDSSAGLVYSYWKDSLANIPVSNPAAITQSGSYYIKGTSNINGASCSIIEPVNVKIIPPIYTTVDTTICDGQVYAGYSQTGVYLDTLTNTDGCDSIRNLILTVNKRIFITVDTTICQGQFYAGYRYAGTYVDTFARAASDGCDSIRTLNLSVYSAPLTIIDTSICNGNNFYGYSATGSYVDSFNSVHGCDSIRIINLTVLPPVDANLGADSILCIGDSIILNPGQFSTYLWQDSSTVSQYIVRHGGVYAVTVTNSCGTARAKITINEDNCTVYFPSAFTPNNDGINDVFRILHAYNLQYYHLLIFNRWGQKLFETQDYLKGWDGKNFGRKADSGTYVWYCEFTRSGTVHRMKGTVELIR